MTSKLVLVAAFAALFSFACTSAPVEEGGSNAQAEAEGRAVCRPMEIETGAGALRVVVARDCTETAEVHHLFTFSSRDGIKTVGFAFDSLDFPEEKSALDRRLGEMLVVGVPGETIAFVMTTMLPAIEGSGQDPQALFASHLLGR